MYVYVCIFTDIITCIICMYIYLLEGASFQKVHKHTYTQVSVLVYLEAKMAIVILRLPTEQICKLPAPFVAYANSCNV